VGVFGGRVPRAVLLLIVAVLATTILTVNGMYGLVLIPQFVLKGEVWRLFTWSLIQPDFLGLIFACLMLWWLGGDLVYAWGPGRFVASFFALTGIAGAIICLLSLVWSTPMTAKFVSTWAIVDAFIVAWALMFPGRAIYQYFVLPLSGRNLIYFTIAAVLLMAALGGYMGFVYALPHFTAIALMLIYMKVPRMRALWSVWRMSGSNPKRPRHLRPVGGDRDDKPRWLH